METQLDKQVKSVQAEHPTWSYDRAVALVVEAKARHEHAGQDPQIQRESEKLSALSEGDPAFEASKYAQLLAEARKLMGKDPLMTFGGAIQIAHENHPELRSIKHGGPRAPGDTAFPAAKDGKSKTS